ncbi:hypothetical protein OGAPHI_003190 [Ogataea philodendri]|uniref:Uncharacterized protein n=1 Tax=Ogataea philodendri TaxID=1378263 RepID=A0A9P8T695_9ASCO|nr:uncharacterized protein OGAPHI_003190 [Ogataea philodendri]KAH3666741.1 hypothetical protein OGAPHI_003190 [Ogataea philodendri]
MFNVVNNRVADKFGQGVVPEIKVAQCLQSLQDHQDVRLILIHTFWKTNEHGEIHRGVIELTTISAVHALTVVVCKTWVHLSFEIRRSRVFEFIARKTKTHDVDQSIVDDWL